MMLRLALPLLLMNVLQLQTPIFFILLFVGQYDGSLELSAIALGNTLVNVFGYSVLIGLATAADTLCPQIYGYKNYKRVGVIFQRGVLILSLACVPIIALWLNTESILLLLRQPPCVVRLAGTYLRGFILALPGLVAFTMLQKYMQAQSLVWVFVAGGLLVNVVLVVCCSIFIVAADMGTVGAALSIFLSSSLAPIILGIFIKWRKLHQKTWDGWSFKSLTEWWQFLRLGLPGLLMLTFEWWSFEISAIVVGTIDETQLGINVVLIQYATLLFMIPLSVGTAVNIRVGNELGAGNPVSAKRVSCIGYGVGVSAGLLISVSLLVFRNEVAKIFTSHQETIDGTGDAMFGAIGIIFLDQIQGIVSGVLRATGRQAKAALVNFIAYYVVGVPLGITLALVVGLQTKGMWIGLTVADIIQTVSLTVLLLTTNWKRQSEKAMRDAAGGEVEAESSDSTCTEEDSVSDSGHDSGIELRDITPGEEGPLEGEDLLVSCKDSEKLVSQDSPPGGWTRTLYSSNRCCRTKASIVISKSMFLLVGVAVLLMGAVLAGTIRHHPTGDDRCSNCSFIGDHCSNCSFMDDQCSSCSLIGDQCSNCSLVCESIFSFNLRTYDVGDATSSHKDNATPHLSPTRTIDEINATPHLSPTRTIDEDNATPHLSPTRTSHKDNAISHTIAEGGGMPHPSP